MKKSIITKTLCEPETVLLKISSSNSTYYKFHKRLKNQFQNSSEHDTYITKVSLQLKRFKSFAGVINIFLSKKNVCYEFLSFNYTGIQFETIEKVMIFFNYIKIITFQEKNIEIILKKSLRSKFLVLFLLVINIIRSLFQIILSNFSESKDAIFV